MSLICISGRLALGLGDNMIRLWNLNTPPDMFDITTLWQGIRGKVTAVSMNIELEDFSNSQPASHYNMIRLWNLNTPPDMFDITTLWQGIRGKVTAVSMNIELEDFSNS